MSCFFNFCKDNPGGNPVIEMPTGSGKSVVIAMIATKLAELGLKTLVLCRQKEIVSQNSMALHRLDPGIDIGQYCGGLNRYDVGRSVTFGTIQSIAKDPHKLGQVNLIIVDEAHQVPPRESSEYGSLVSEIRKYNPRCVMLGLTATPFRLSSGLIYGEGKVFDDCIYAVPLAKMLQDGAVTGWRIPHVTEVNLSDIPKVGSDFDEGLMSIEFMTKVEENVKEILSATVDRKKILVFATTVLHADCLKHALIQATHEDVRIITGDTGAVSRSQTTVDFLNGSLRWIVNCGVLTTGFDAKNVDAIAICRGTHSHSLFYQIIGRGMRKCPGKKDFLVLDFGGNFDRLGSPDDPNYGRPKEEAKRVHCTDCGEYVDAEDVRCGDCGCVMRTKECPICKTVVPADTKICPGVIKSGSLFPEECGRDLAVRRCAGVTDAGGGEEKCDAPIGPGDERCSVCNAEVQRRKHGKFNSNCHVLGPQKQYAYRVENVSYEIHNPKDAAKSPSLKATYLCNHIDPEEAGNLTRKRIPEWICIEHDGFAKQKAKSWWERRSLNEFPENCYEAVELASSGALMEPDTITVTKDGHFWRIVSGTFPEGSCKGLSTIEMAPPPPF